MSGLNRENLSQQLIHVVEPRRPMQGVTSRDQKTLGDPLPASKGPVALPGRAQPWSLVPNQHRCSTKTQGRLFSGTSITNAERSFCAGQPRKGSKALIIRFHGQSDLLTGGVTWLLCATAVCTHWCVCLYTLGHVCVGGYTRHVQAHPLAL